MREFKYIIRDKNGLHARPAGMLTTVAKGFESSVTVKAGEKEADGKRLLSLMSLGAKQGTELHFIIEGEDEERAETALKKHCEERLSGGEYD
ncbi:MAG: HPr family phosphocarrier protein [Clostridia bacterium]|nr:HPr family phosphocarrier protein [Clostridia bacterium]